MGHPVKLYQAWAPKHQINRAKIYTHQHNKTWEKMLIIAQQNSQPMKHLRRT